MGPKDTRYCTLKAVTEPSALLEENMKAKAKEKTKENS